MCQVSISATIAVVLMSDGVLINSELQVRNFETVDIFCYFLLFQLCNSNLMQFYDVFLFDKFLAVTNQDKIKNCIFSGRFGNKHRCEQLPCICSWKGLHKRQHVKVKLCNLLYLLILLYGDVCVLYSVILSENSCRIQSAYNAHPNFYT